MVHGHSRRGSSVGATVMNKRIQETHASAARLAQSVERKALNLVVVGSSSTVGGIIHAPCKRALAAPPKIGSIWRLAAQWPH